MVLTHEGTGVLRDEVPEPTARAVVASEMSTASSIFAIFGGRRGAEGEDGGSRPRVGMEAVARERREPCRILRTRSAGKCKGREAVPGVKGECCSSSCWK